MSAGLRLLLLATILAGSLQGASTPHAEEIVNADSLLARADRQAEAWDFAAAIESFRAALAAEPGDWRARIGLVQALVDRGETLDSKDSRAYYEEAANLADALAADHPDSARAHYLSALASGQLALFLGGKEKVKLSRRIKQSMDRSLALDDSDSEAWTARGVYYYELATLSMALRLFAKVLFGGVPPGTLADAKRDLERALELDPGKIAAHNQLAWTLYKLEDHEGALAHCERIRGLPDVDHEDANDRLDAAELQEKVEKRLRQRRARRGG